MEHAAFMAFFKENLGSIVSFWETYTSRFGISCTYGLVGKKTHLINDCNQWDCRICLGFSIVKQASLTAPSGNLLQFAIEMTIEIVDLPS